jgi:hypothetical protein
MLFLNISDGHSFMNGRKVFVDIAKSQSHNNHRKDKNYHQNNKDRRRGGDYADIDGSKFRAGIHNDKSNETKERIPLKLQPRTKPVEEPGVRPSDDMNWRSASSKDSSDHGRGRGRGSGRGHGRGSGSGRSHGRGSGRAHGRGSGRGRGSVDGEGTARQSQGYIAKKDNEDKKVSKEASVDGWDSAQKTFRSDVAPTVVKEEKKAITKVSNAFAALQVDSDSE